MSYQNNKWINLTDINVFQQQYTDNFCQLKYFGMRYLKDEDIVCDLIQDVWLKVWEKKEKHINEAAFKYYLFRSLYRAILDYIKHDNIVRKYVENILDSEEVEQDITYKIIESEIYQSINQIFDRLPNTCRRVYSASLSGKSQKEIAEEFCISINTVKKHINNANHYMKKFLKDFLLFFLSLR